MSASADPNANGKAPAERSGLPPSHHHTGTVKVQPASVSDLQPKYAQQLKYDTDQAAEHSWYASLSKCLGNHYWSSVYCT